jgi:hypothetical protein
MTIQKDGLDFQHEPKDLAKIIDQIDRELFGLFANSEFQMPNSEEPIIRNS